MSIICEGDIVTRVGSPLKLGKVTYIDPYSHRATVDWEGRATSSEKMENLTRVKRRPEAAEGASVHPLHTIAFIQQHIESTGRYPGKRCTGRTTAIALRAIAAALEKPGVPVKLRDHHDSPVAHKILGDYCYELVRKMGLKHFTFTKDDLVFGIPGATYE